jgi:hypothetical protein
MIAEEWKRCNTLIREWRRDIGSGKPEIEEQERG